MPAASRRSKQQSNQDYLSDLIQRMTRPEKLQNSDNSVSWKAHREAERLRDRSMFDELALWVRSEKDKQRRRAMYFTMRKIGRNLGCSECAKRLVDCLDVETEKWCIAEILEGVGEIKKPAGFDYLKVVPWLSEKRWAIRFNAITAFGNSVDPDAEGHVIRHLRQTKDPDDQVYCHAVLLGIGTTRAIPAIEPNTTSRKVDVKLSAQQAIQAIKARCGVDERSGNGRPVLRDGKKASRRSKSRGS